MDCPLGATKKAPAFYSSCSILLTQPLSPSFLCSFSSSFFLPFFYSFLECGRRGAAGRPRRRLGGGPRGEAATTPGTALGCPGGGGSRPGGRPGLSRAPAHTLLSPKSHWGVGVGEARRVRGDSLWQMLGGRRGAEALLLCPSSPAGFRGDGLTTILTLVLSWRLTFFVGKKLRDWSRRLGFDTVQQHGRAEGK